MATPTLAIIRTESAELSRVQDNVARSLNPVLSAVAATPIMGAKPPPWQIAQLQNGFTAWGSGFAAPAYMLDALGFVHVRGLAKTVAGAISGTVVLVLPVGMRPSASLTWAANSGTGSHVSMLLHVDGSMFIGTNLGAGDGVAVNFDFLAEQ